VHTALRLTQGARAPFVKEAAEFWQQNRQPGGTPPACHHLPQHLGDKAGQGPTAQGDSLRLAITEVATQPFEIILNEQPRDQEGQQTGLGALRAGYAGPASVSCA
jgi:hypothetical protein